MSAEDAPIFTVYVPGSMTHDELAGSNDARLRGSRSNVSVCDSPGPRSPVLAKALSSIAGFASRPSGALTYSCTTSLPATFPVFFTVTVAWTFLSNVVELSLTSPYSNVVYESP